MNDLREWLFSKLSDSVEIGGDDELILGFIRNLDVAPSATGETAIGHARYEYVRTLSPRQFADLYDEALHGDRFDHLVDRYRDASQPSPTTREQPK